MENSSNTSLATTTSSGSGMSDHLKDRLKNLENVVVACRNIVEQSLTQLHQYKNMRSRRSVSPLPDKKDTFKMIERNLVDAVKLLRDSCENCLAGNAEHNEVLENNPVKIALIQLEGQLKSKLGELLKQRRVLRETNQLTHKKDLELLAERVAFESVCFGKLRDSLSRADKPETFQEHQSNCEIAETSQLMTRLKAKLSGKSCGKTNGSVDVLASVLARRLMTTASKLSQIEAVSEMPSKFSVNAEMLDDLLRQQNELQVITKRYKSNTIENLGHSLAAETLNYISSNATVQGAVQEAWRHAQETVNTELIQSEISHVMLKTAQRYESSISPSFGYALTSQERVSFERFADAVQDSLRKEMEVAVHQLTQCYEESLAKMKQGQWRLHLEQERKASEGRQILVEFADIVAHKALIDARISVIRGEVPRDYQEYAEDQESPTSITTMQKYENLFAELSEDLNVTSPDDLLAEADFSFMFKHFTMNMMSLSANKQDMNDLSTAIIKLEEHLLLLHNKLNPDININQITNLNLDNMKNISIKLNEFQNTIESILYAVDKIQSAPCNDCDKIHETLLELTNQHDDLMDNYKRKNSDLISSLNEQLDEQTRIIKQLECDKIDMMDKLNHEKNITKLQENEFEELSEKMKHVELLCEEKSSETMDLVDQLSEVTEKQLVCRQKADEIAKRLREEQEKLYEVEKDHEYLYEQFNKEQEKCKRLEKQLEHVKMDHSDQLEQLNQIYNEQLLANEHLMDKDKNDEENLRQKYQDEIEQLRVSFLNKKKLFFANFP